MTDEYIQGISSRQFGYKDKNRRNSILEVCIPPNVVYIGDATFAYCSNLRKVSFMAGYNLRYIGEGAFQECVSLESFDFDLLENLNYIGRSAFSDSGLKSIKFRHFHNLCLGDYCFSNCHNLVSVEKLPSKIIPTHCFDNCEHLLSVSNSSSGFYAVEDSAFLKCDSLSEFKYEKPFFGDKVKVQLNNDCLFAALKKQKGL